MTKSKKRVILMVAIAAAVAVTAGAVAYITKFFRIPRAAVKYETAMQIFTDQFDEINRRFGFSFETYTMSSDETSEIAELYGEAVLESGETLTLKFGTIGSVLSYTLFVDSGEWDTWEEAYQFVQQRDLKQYTRVYDLVSYLSDGMYGGNRLQKELIKQQKEIVSMFPDYHESTVGTSRSFPLSLYFSNVNSAYVSYDAYRSYDADEEEYTGKWMTTMVVGTCLYVQE